MDWLITTIRYILSEYSLLSWKKTYSWNTNEVRLFSRWKYVESLMDKSREELLTEHGARGHRCLARETVQAVLCGYRDTRRLLKG